MLAENSGIAENNYLLVADIDIERIQADRLKGKTYQDCAGTYGSAVSMRQILIRYPKLSKATEVFAASTHTHLHRGDSNKTSEALYGYLPYADRRTCQAAFHLWRKRW